MYGKSLAFIHQGWYTGLADGAAQFIEQTMPNIQGPIVDLGCGSGALLMNFMDRIQEGFGFDVSTEMIQLAQETIPNYQFQVADLFASPIPRAQVVTMIGEILSYASHGQENLEQILGQFFTRIYQQLTEDGLFLFDVLAEGSEYNYHHLREEAEWTLMMESKQAGAEVTRKIITFHVQDGMSLYAKSTEIHSLLVFNKEWIQRLLQECGFSVHTMLRYADIPLPAGRVAFYCRKA